MKKHSSRFVARLRYRVLFPVICIVIAIASSFLMLKQQAQKNSTIENLISGNPVFSAKSTEKAGRVSQMIENYKNSGAIFERRNLFEANARQLTGADKLGAALDKGVILELDKTAVSNLLREKPQYLVLPIADGRGGAVELELAQVNIFAPGFSVETSQATGENYKESLGVHYRGIIKDDSKSLASVSIFKNEVMGIFSTPATGNAVVGRLGGKNPTDRHILYDDQNLKNRPSFSCDAKTPDEATLPEPPPQTREEFVARCVRIYVEAGYDLFQNKGTVAATAGYIAGFFNQTATLVATTGVTARLSKVFVWNSPSPFNEATTSAQLQAFYNLRKTFDGDIAHLVDLQLSGAGLAYINAYCGAGSDRRHGYTGIFTDYSPVPTYSDTVFLFSHELGHNLGSQHTHACLWNGNNTAIDGCSAIEGACPDPGLPPMNGGTLMSYCVNVVGVNFALGYGPQPSERILTRYNSAACLTDCDATMAPKKSFDFDGDRRADISVFRPSNGTWYLQQSASGFTGNAFGTTGDLITPADFDGDGKTDIAVFRPSSGTWYLQQSTGGFAGVAFGQTGDVPVPADYDGDGRADVAVFRPSSGAWYIQRSTSGFIGIAFGQNGDRPAPADYDGDGNTDIAVNRAGIWYIQRSSAGFYGIAFGDGADKLVPADYDGDGKADVAVFRPSSGTWYLQRSMTGFTGVAFGTNEDLPVAADYDGDGKADIAVFRPSSGAWYLQRSTQGFMGVSFGATSDKPAPNAFVQ